MRWLARTALMRVQFTAISSGLGHTLSRRQRCLRVHASSDTRPLSASLYEQPISCPPATSVGARSSGVDQTTRPLARPARETCHATTGGSATIWSTTAWPGSYVGTAISAFCIASSRERRPGTINTPSQLAILSLRARSVASRTEPGNHGCPVQAICQTLCINVARVALLCVEAIDMAVN